MLEDAKAALEHRFAALAGERAQAGLPVYALEHGLPPSDIDALKVALGERLRLQHAPNHADWLGWTVIAAETGYGYDGDEYWRSLGRDVPNWSVYGDRGAIRRAYATFVTRYHGFRPRGRWARHFSIIALPISHAILPIYLQTQFAAHIHALRFELATLDGDSEAFGSLLQARYDGGSSLFANFLEQTDLTSRLLLALRDEDVQGGTPPLDRATLDRIVADVSSRQHARDQLADARAVLRRGRLRVAGGLAPRSESASARASEALGAVRLVARQTGSGSWRIGVALPRIDAILAAKEIGRDTLDATRVRLPGELANWKPGRALIGLSGQEHRLEALPANSRVIELERSTLGLQRVVDEFFSLKGGAPYLLRICEDGAARQVVGRSVRSGECYLLVSSTELPETSGLALTALACDVSVHLYQFEVAAPVADEVIRGLASLKIGFAPRARAIPVGLVPRWDVATEGSVWLIDEPIMIAIESDVPVSEYVIATDDDQRARVTADGRSTLVTIEGLPPGRHEITIEPHLAATASDVRRDIQPEVLTVTVRAAKAWPGDIVRRAGFRIAIEPPESTIEAVIARDADVTILGPAGRSLQMHIAGFDANGHQRETRTLGAITLPATPARVEQVVGQIGTAGFAELIDGSPRIDLVVSAEELGTQRVSFTHAVRPLRWKMATSSGGTTVRLVDETDDEASVELRSYALSRPDLCLDRDKAECLAGVVVEPPGMLFAAMHNRQRHAVFVSAFSDPTLRSLRDLGADVQLSPITPLPDGLLRLLLVLRDWTHARPLGPLAVARKRQALAPLLQRVAAYLCGSDWAAGWQPGREADATLLTRLQQGIGASGGFGSLIRSGDWPRVLTSEHRTAFGILAVRYQVMNDAAFAERALRFAFNPAGMRFGTPDQARAFVEQLRANRPLVRGVFLARIVSESGRRGAVPWNQA